MNRILGLLAVFLLLGVSVFGQQDPTDPGIQDSIIIGSIQIDSSAQTWHVQIPVYAVTDDSVAMYNIPIRWTAPHGGVRIEPGTIFHWPLNCDYAFHYDTVLTNDGYIRIVGWTDFYDTTGRNPCALFTNGLRLNVITLRVIVDANAPVQVVTLDTTWDDRNYSVIFGIGITEFRPAIQRGFITIGPGVGIDENVSPPQSFSLSQNYPNPFNPSTNIAFSINQSGEASLVIYDLLGRRVRSLLNNRLEAGSYIVTWNGRNDAGSDMASGTYLYRLVVGNKSETKRMALIR